jgi:hypothetical protein
MISWLSTLFARKSRKTRREDRENKVLPVKIVGDDVPGVTRDLGLSGVYFETSSRYEVGSSIKMMIDFEGPEGMKLDCEGTIVRVEDRGSDKMGVAVRMNIKSRTLILPKQESPAVEGSDKLSATGH